MGYEPAKWLKKINIKNLKIRQTVLYYFILFIVTMQEYPRGLFNSPMFSLAKLYGGLLLAQRIETSEQFNLIVRWQSLEDHTPGFEASEDHRMFMMPYRIFL